MAFRVDKLKRLWEQNITEGRGATGYRSQLKEMFGLSEDDYGAPVLNRSERILDPKNVSIGEVAWTFLGREFGGSDIRRAFGLTEQYGRFEEAEGAVVLPSHFARISAFSDTVAGLVDALTMEAYQAPEFIGDKLMEVKQARVNGGKMIGVMNDGQVSGDLLDGEPYPAGGLKETYVDVPDNQRYGNVIQINEKTFIYDRTDLLESACKNAGTAVARLKEIRQADCVLGITNTYSRDGNAANTYLTTVSDVPNNYVNSSTNQLTNYASIDSAYQILEGNTDPGTGFEVTVSAPQLLVMPQREMNAKSILYPEWVRRLSDTGNTATQTAQSLVRPVELIVASRVWYNRLIAASVSTTNAPERWHLGDFKRAFQYRQIIPFSVTSAPLSSEDARRDIAAIWIAREHGVPFTKEPRFTYRGTKE
ncbi:hypothetical protein VT84_13600 [Gemmata sp. SH-PL17]|uniref:phage major capsid protein n=1 Tax=Gemmata sp. SH-PL17 TaxID=1630693 RepID=UPI00078B4739|nr:hypothetical protein [Gemmata sp. SH-PL17]AMV25431.1 hypothetical protein VT84_13600 [Gemmata sp. SH-PL17]